MKKIKWLHLSDIHLNKQDVDTRLMRKKLPEYLRENHILCDYIFFTGAMRHPVISRRIPFPFWPLSATLSAPI